MTGHPQERRTPWSKAVGFPGPWGCIVPGMPGMGRQDPTAPGERAAVPAPCGLVQPGSGRPSADADVCIFGEFHGS